MLALDITISCFPVVCGLAKAISPGDVAAGKLLGSSEHGPKSSRRVTNTMIISLDAN